MLGGSDLADEVVDKILAMQEVSVNECLTFGMGPRGRRGERSQKSQVGRSQHPRKAGWLCWDEPQLSKIAGFSVADLHWPAFHHELRALLKIARHEVAIHNKAAAHDLDCDTPQPQQKHALVLGISRRGVLVILLPCYGIQATGRP